VTRLINRTWGRLIGTTKVRKGRRDKEQEETKQEVISKTKDEKDRTRSTEANGYRTEEEHEDKWTTSTEDPSTLKTNYEETGIMNANSDERRETLTTRKQRKTIRGEYRDPTMESLSTPYSNTYKEHRAKMMSTYSWTGTWTI
jgi:hypothetical protein